MKALIVAEASGAELWPLSQSVPEPLVHFANKPIILHQMEALKAAGVEDILVASNSKLKEVMTVFSNEYKAKLGIKITCLHDTGPAGIASPLVPAWKRLIGETGKHFFVLNGDIICDYPFKQLLDFHRSHKGEVSIMVAHIVDPSRYGALIMEERTGKVKHFVEKPINGGIYLMNSSVLNRSELWHTSVEKELLPRIAADDMLYGMSYSGLWLSLGNIVSYFEALPLYLDSLRQKSSLDLAVGTHILGNVLVAETAKLGEGAEIGPNVAIGPGCLIERGVRISFSTIMEGVLIKKGACISNSILGRHSVIGQWARVHLMILEDDTKIFDRVTLIRGVRCMDGQLC